MELQWLSADNRGVVQSKAFLQFDADLRPFVGVINADAAAAGHTQDTRS